MKALVFGASGGLAHAIAQEFLERQWQLDLVTRQPRRKEVEQAFHQAVGDGRLRVLTVEKRYATFAPTLPFDACFFTQALFSPGPFVAMSDAEIAQEIEVGLLDLIQLTRKLLAADAPLPDQRRDYCFIGSTSAYAGFRNTSVYCAVKHGLLGFVRALNDEYAHTGCRFWLFSMGTMDTAMGRKLTEQDPISFLRPAEVAGRIAEAVCSGSNVFEPEVILRRRTIRYLKGGA